MLREQRKRLRRKRRKQLLVALALTGIFSVSIIESAAHVNEATNQNHFTNIATLESVKDNGFGDIRPLSKDEQKKEELDREESGKENNVNDDGVVKPAETTENDVKEEKEDAKQEQVSQEEIKQEENNKEENNKEENKKDELNIDNKNEIEKDNFSDAVFIGDSRTEGLQINTGLTTARFLAAKGLMVDTALKNNVIKLKNGSRGTVIDGLKEGTYNRVYVMFGMNELGWPYLDVFTSRYEKLITEIKKVQPNATIYVQSILPVSKAKSDKDSIYNNENISKFNKAIKDMADKNGYIYLDVASAVTDSNSALPSNASSDGVHLNKEYSQKWLNYLRDTK